MIIPSIKSKLETSSHPIAQALHQNTSFRVLAIAFKKGMVLKAHKAHKPSKLFVLEGAVNYTENNKTVSLRQYEETDIPVEIIHEVEAIEDSLCLLTQGD
ncbi:hypothetical protein KZP23_10565 [Echinicola marina]|uniref:hypothetical protein n=1 Tax=Echinicola marina TaxID=2859768 RepID=UPI001CF6A054|nr:hypothetical protein [Echinicola marina]UCS95415.1 hypothetical protein KZP23_10565 [Echinicola marina]